MVILELFKYWFMAKTSTIELNPLELEENKKRY